MSKYLERLYYWHLKFRSDDHLSDMFCYAVKYSEFELIDVLSNLMMNRRAKAEQDYKRSWRP